MAREVALLGPDHAIRRGFPWRLTLRRLQPGPARRPVDLTGMNAAFEIYDTGAPRRPPWAFVCQIADPASGIVRIALTAAETASIRAASARYRLVFTDSLGDAAVLLYGRLALLEHDK
ncbi:MAG: hypothetical protein LBI92_06830 [Azoarcus sp.]|jgi:hypothetical protein|nr:hypothetical protein [Azoarcus sp.]